MLLFGIKVLPGSSIYQKRIENGELKFIVVGVSLYAPKWDSNDEKMRRQIYIYTKISTYDIWMHF